MNQSRGKLTRCRIRCRFGDMARVLATIALFATLLANIAGAEAGATFRRPIALALTADEQTLLVANRDSGTVSVLHADTLKCLDEVQVGGRLSDIVILPTDNVIVTDVENHRLVLLRRREKQWHVATEVSVAAYPARIVCDNPGSRCFVTSLWSRKISEVKLSQTDNHQLLIRRELSLPFAPRELLLLEGGDTVIAAGAFAAKLAVISKDGLNVEAQHNIPGHNIAGLAVSHDGSRLFVSQQDLNPLAHSTRDDVHWGNMISNLLVSYPVGLLFDSTTNLVAKRVATELGEPGAGAGDPGGIHINDEGEAVILLSGVHEVAVGTVRKSDLLERISVGTRPVAQARCSNGRLFVANMFSDSVSVIDLHQPNRVTEVSLGKTPNIDTAHFGEIQFFDARLSHDGWMSCHSCHTDGHANGQLNDNFSDGSFGAPKRVLSLLGVADTSPWSWTGSVTSLEDQVRNSIERTMQGRPANERQLAGITAFMKALPLPVVRLTNVDDQETEAGRQLFGSLGCTQCHIPPTFTSPQIYDVGIADDAGNERFNPPSLRGIANRESFFHDGRSRSVMDLLRDHKHQLDRAVTEAEMAALTRFLQSI